MYSVRVRRLRHEPMMPHSECIEWNMNQPVRCGQTVHPPVSILAPCPGGSEDRNEQVKEG